jgi:RNA polymerase sigma-70 factor (ECF subfamily)
MSLEPSNPERLAGCAPVEDLDWSAVYADHLPRVYNYFRFRLGPDDVEDLTARTFEKAWGARGRFRRDLAGFSTWLFRIAHNVGVDHLRARRQHLPLEAAEERIAEDSPERSAELASDLARLAELCALLSERDRELIALKYGAGVNNRLIARLMGLTESNVGTILHRAVALLRAHW